MNSLRSHAKIFTKEDKNRSLTNFHDILEKREYENIPKSTKSIESNDSSLKQPCYKLEEINNQILNQPKYIKTEVNEGFKSIQHNYLTVNDKENMKNKENNQNDQNNRKKLEIFEKILKFDADTMTKDEYDNKLMRYLSGMEQKYESLLQQNQQLRMDYFEMEKKFQNEQENSENNIEKIKILNEKIENLSDELEISQVKNISLKDDHKELYHPDDEVYHLKQNYEKLIKKLQKKKKKIKKLKENLSEKQDLNQKLNEKQVEIRDLNEKICDLIENKSEIKKKYRLFKIKSRRQKETVDQFNENFQLLQEENNYLKQRDSIFHDFKEINEIKLLEHKEYIEKMKNYELKNEKLEQELKESQKKIAFIKMRFTELINL